MQHVQPDQLSHALTWIYQRDPQRQLSFFEYLTLASLYLFKQNDLDLIILEIGLGGRLDANNCLDHDVAIITSVDLDHTAWLGNTLDKIASEKAGIIRKKKTSHLWHEQLPKTHKKNQPGTPSIIIY